MLWPPAVAAPRTQLFRLGPFPEIINTMFLVINTCLHQSSGTRSTLEVVRWYGYHVAVRQLVAHHLAPTWSKWVRSRRPWRQLARAPEGVARRSEG